jgi:flagellar basal body-associated protein FliL
MPFIIALIVRIVLFLAGLVPLLRWVLRKAHEAQDIPSDPELNRHTEAARAGVTPEPPWFFGRPIHERVREPRN